MGALKENIIRDGGPINTPLLALHPFDELVNEDEDTLAKIQQDALDAHVAKPETRHGDARCGIGSEIDRFEQVSSSLEQPEGHGGANSVETSSHSLHVSVVTMALLEQIAQMITEGRAEASQFKLIVGCVVWKKDQLASEWDRNYLYGAESSATRVRNLAMTQLSTQYANGTLNGTVDNISRADALLKMRRMVVSETVSNFCLSSIEAPSAAKEHAIAGMLLGALAQMSEGVEKSKFDLYSPPDNVKAELFDELSNELTAETRVPLLVQRDLLQKHLLTSWVTQ